MNFSSHYLTCFRGFLVVVSLEEVFMKRSFSSSLLTPRCAKNINHCEKLLYLLSSFYHQMCCMIRKKEIRNIWNSTKLRMKNRLSFSGYKRFSFDTHVQVRLTNKQIKICSSSVASHQEHVGSLVHRSFAANELFFLRIYLVSLHIRHLLYHDAAIAQIHNLRSGHWKHRTLLS